MRIGPPFSRSGRRASRRRVGAHHTSPPVERSPPTAALARSRARRRVPTPQPPRVVVSSSCAVGSITIITPSRPPPTPLPTRIAEWVGEGGACQSREQRDRSRAMMHFVAVNRLPCALIVTHTHTHTIHCTPGLGLLT